MEPGWTLGYARVSTDSQDLTAQTDALVALGVPAERVFTDKGMTGPLMFSIRAPYPSVGADFYCHGHGSSSFGSLGARLAVLA